MGCDRKTNPFRLEDGHPFAVLMANSFAVHRYLNTLPDKDQVKRGEWLGKIHDVFPLKRGFGTIIDGVSIGSATPPEHKYKQPQIHKITAIQKNSHQTLNIQNPKKRIKLI